MTLRNVRLVIWPMKLDTVSLNGTGGIFNIVKRSQENMPHILRTFPGT